MSANFDKMVAHYEGSLREGIIRISDGTEYEGSYREHLLFAAAVGIIDSITSPDNEDESSSKVVKVQAVLRARKNLSKP